MRSKYIQSVGIELEGGINNDDLKKVYNWLERNKLKKYFSEGPDGSISGLDADIYIELKFWQNLKDIDNLFEFLKIVYNNGFVTNRSCGFHVHLRLKNIEHWKIFSYRRFFREFVREYKKSFKSDKYLQRLTNEYCKAIWREKDIKEQINNTYKVSARYRAINLNAVNLYETVEIRIMPYQSTANEAIKSLKWIIKTTHKLFRKYNKKALYVKNYSFDEMLEEYNREVRCFNPSNEIEYYEDIINKKIEIEVGGW